MKSPSTKFALINKFYTKQEFIEYVKSINIRWIKTNKKVEYANIPCVIDIESSSFIDTNGEKTACMYCFTFGINGASYLGRTYDDLFDILEETSKILQNDVNKRIVVYIHNLAYEFQFFYKRFAWSKVFAINPRTPCTAITSDGYEFRCSLLLSGYSLAKVGEHLQKYKVEKMVGDLDYSKIRHSNTPLSEEETKYVLNDGLVVMAYIQEQIESHNNDITKIPLTKTGEVRKFVRNQCLYGGGGSHKKSVGQYNRYREIMYATQIASVNEYKQLKRAFYGGFTHANALIVGQVQKDVTSFDFTSSYPYVMVSEQFPMLQGELIELKSKEMFDECINYYCCLFDVTFFDLNSKIWFEHYISESHCRGLENERIDNGRIVSADKLTMTITEQDFFIIKECYSWTKMVVKNMRRYQRDYLPKPFVTSVLKLYKDKTILKGVKGKEVEYLYSKELVNSTYGMCVTDICRSETPFDTEHNVWSEEIPEIDYVKSLERYNNSSQRFLSFAWGVWVTAYARRNLWTLILQIGHDYCYSDTDSVKIINAQKHQKVIDDYNINVLKKLARAVEYHGLSMDDVSPKTIKGETKTLGIAECDEKYEEFATLGAKRYMVKKDGQYSLTISGLNKKSAIPYLVKTYGNPFNAFHEDMYIPPNATGKNTHTYIDEERQGVVKDYRGVYGEYHEYSCVHIEPCDYTLSLASEYISYLLDIQTIAYN